MIKSLVKVHFCTVKAGNFVARTLVKLINNKLAKSTVAEERAVQYKKEAQQHFSEVIQSERTKRSDLFASLRQAQRLISE